MGSQAKSKFDSFINMKEEPHSYSKQKPSHWGRDKKKKPNNKGKNQKKSANARTENINQSSLSLYPL